MAGVLQIHVVTKEDSPVTQFAYQRPSWWTQMGRLAGNVLNPRQQLTTTDEETTTDKPGGVISQEVVIHLFYNSHCRKSSANYLCHSSHI